MSERKLTRASVFLTEKQQKQQEHRAKKLSRDLCFCHLSLEWCGQQGKWLYSFIPKFYSSTYYTNIYGMQQLGYLFLLLYADDTIVLTECPEDLQRALDMLKIYCEECVLFVTVVR